MADYIDRKVAETAAHKAFCKYDNALQYAEMIHQLSKIPAADVVERKRGEWIEKALDTFRKYSVTCPFCGMEYIDNYDGYVSTGDFNYCPNCGADMRKEVTDG